MREPYKDGYFWRDRTSWGLGKGDLGFNTCDKMIRDNDKSEWAYNALLACMDLLIRGVRWPNRMNEDMDSKNRLEYIRYRWAGKIKRWLGHEATWKYRWQTGMTRDPYTAFYAACVVLGHPKLISDVQPMWYNYKPGFWNWWRYLSTRNAKYLKRFRFWSRFSFSKKDYVSRLGELREIAIQGI